MVCPKFILICALTIAMPALAFPYSKEWVLFSLHIIGMSIFIWASITASLILQRVAPEAKTLDSRTRNIRTHALLQIMACLACCVGFWAVYQNKSNSGKTHWKSWHGVMGLVTVILIVAISVLGSWMRFCPVFVFGSIRTCRKWLDFKRYLGVTVLLLTVFETGTGLLERSTIERIPMWERYTIFVTVVIAVGLCFWNCIFEYFGKLFRRGPAYVELA
ncbi:hypothetical protein HDU98_001372 [Podochytrium sp. JEL0797]|nr:hypothetical protein HDU98_001372 [Podochytrium sp. JEL0797]